MGEWDFYCFLCGTTFNPGSATIESGEDDDQENNAPAAQSSPSTLLTPENLAWLGNWRVIGENPAASGLRRCYLSGPAEEDMYGTADVAKGKDPVAPGESQDDKVSTGMYRDNNADDEVGALPVHDACLRVLQRVAMAQGLTGRDEVKKDDDEYGFDLDGFDGIESPADSDDDETAENDVAIRRLINAESANSRLNIDALYRCVSPKRFEFRCSLTIDYGVMNDVAEEQYFYLQKGQEVCFHSSRQCVRLTTLAEQH